MSNRPFKLLVGDNAFHGISHLSQQRARDRVKYENPSDPSFAAELVKLSLENGANGFMFSVSETTLAILRNLGNQKNLDLYAIVPYAYEYVRRAISAGGIPGLAKEFSKQIIFSRNFFTIAPYGFGLMKFDLNSLLKTYLTYEISRIKASAGKGVRVRSVLLHEVVTDMALALDLDWFFESYIQFFSGRGIKAGFETRNFPLLVRKFNDWSIDPRELVITASFNKIGFQMNPSQNECEQSLNQLPDSEVIAMSILAAGYLQPHEAVSYIRTLPKLTGVVAGVSKRSHAEQTFSLLKEMLAGQDNTICHNAFAGDSL